MLLQLNQIIVSPGQQLLLKNISWQEFETILNELGESRSTRVSYSKGMLEIMAPSPEHEVSKKILGDLVSALLDELNIDFWPLGSVTIKKQSMREGVEPDECYYIANANSVRGRGRLNFEIDPPPDLAIEVDITSRTAFDNYEALGVLEFWRYDGVRLKINILREGRYIETQSSNIFPNIDVVNILPRLLALSKIEGRAASIREMRAIAQGAAAWFNLSRD